MRRRGRQLRAEGPRKHDDYFGNRPALRISKVKHVQSGSFRTNPFGTFRGVIQPEQGHERTCPATHPLRPKMVLPISLNCAACIRQKDLGGPGLNGNEGHHVTDLQSSRLTRADHKRARTAKGNAAPIAWPERLDRARPDQSARCRCQQRSRAVAAPCAANS